MSSLSLPLPVSLSRQCHRPERCAGSHGVRLIGAAMVLQVVR
jgi:hypothetical protein